MWSERYQRHIGVGAELLISSRPLVGPIELGEVFCWEPDLSHANELCVVSKIKHTPEGNTICTWDLNYQKQNWNSEERFREACVRTRFNHFPTEPPAGIRFDGLPKGQLTFALDRGITSRS